MFGLSLCWAASVDGASRVPARGRAGHGGETEAAFISGSNTEQLVVIRCSGERQWDSGRKGLSLYYVSIYEKIEIYTYIWFFNDNPF